MAQIGGASCLARAVSDALGERQLLVQLVPHPVDGPEREQGPSERAPKVDRSCDGVAALRQVAERLERLLETRQRLPVGGMPMRPVARLLREGHGLVPSLAPEGVMGQAVDVLRQAAGVEPFDGIDDAGVESATLILEKARVGDLVCERVLEAVLEVEEERRFVEELAALEPTEATAQVGVRCLTDGLEQGERDILANDRGGLEEPLVVGWE